MIDAQLQLWLLTQIQGLANIFLPPESRNDAVDKCRDNFQYIDALKPYWTTKGLPFHHAALIYSLTWNAPLRYEVHDPTITPQPEKWVVDHYQRFKPYLDYLDQQYPVGGQPDNEL